MSYHLYVNVDRVSNLSEMVSDQDADRVLARDITILINRSSGCLGTRLNVFILADFEIFQAVHFGTSL